MGGGGVLVGYVRRTYPEAILGISIPAREGWGTSDWFVPACVQLNDPVSWERGSPVEEEEGRGPHGCEARAWIGRRTWICLAPPHSKKAGSKEEVQAPCRSRRCGNRVFLTWATSPVRAGLCQLPASHIQSSTESSQTASPILRERLSGGNVDASSLISL